MLRFVYFLENNLAIDCNPSKYHKKGHSGVLANNPIDDSKVNVKYDVVRKDNSIMYDYFVHLYNTELLGMKRKIGTAFLLVISTILGLSF